MKKSLGAITLVYPTPVFVVGTYDRGGKPNAMAVAWGGICCSKPPCVAISLRKATYSYGNIIEQEAFTISIPSEDYVKEADYFGIASGRDEDKFARTGLTPVKSDLVNAPYVKEFPLVLECRVLHTIEIGLHTQFIGEIMDVKVDDNCMGGDGLPDIARVRPFIFLPEHHRYRGIGEEIGRAFFIGRDIQKK
ncbi:MAG: flavin reductase family protein [Candidatus Aureabacteria bacterium]|nr:flavin reductase family protein [Candidatus Auribacterota bacterium]